MRKTILVAIGVVLFILFFIQLNIKDIFLYISSINPFWLLVIIAFNIPLLLFKSVRWQVVLRKLNIQPNFKEIFKAVSAGFFLGVMTPATSGELGRILAIETDNIAGAVAIVYEKVSDMLTLIFLAFSGFLILIFNSQTLIISLVTLWGIFILIVLLILNYHPILKNTANKILNKFLKNKLDFFKKGGNNLENLLSDKKLMCYNISVSMILWAIPAGQFYIICKLLLVPTTLRLIMISFFIPYLAGVLSFIPQGLGVRDFSILGILVGIFGISPLTAGSVVILFRIACTLPLVIWGFFCYIYQIIKLG